MSYPFLGDGSEANILGARMFSASGIVFNIS